MRLETHINPCLDVHHCTKGENTRQCSFNNLVYLLNNVSPGCSSLEQKQHIYYTLNTPVDHPLEKNRFSSLTVFSIFTLDNQIMLLLTAIAYIRDMAALI